MVHLALFISCFLYFFITSPVYAARSVSISSEDTSLFGDEEAQITVSPSGFTDGETIYIKGAFYQDGGTNYFGYTKNGDNWIKNGESTIKQNSIKIGEWNNKLAIKSDFTDSGYKGEGDYLFKIGFYYTTSGGNLSSVNWSSNNLVFSINEPDPIQSPAPSQHPVNNTSPSSSPTNTSATSQSASNSKKSPLPSPKPTANLAKNVLGEKTDVATSSANVDNVNQVSPSPLTANIQEGSKKIAGIFIGIGSVMIAVSVAIYLWYKRLSDKQAINKEEDKSKEK